MEIELLELYLSRCPMLLRNVEPLGWDILLKIIIYAHRMEEHWMRKKNNDL